MTQQDVKNIILNHLKDYQPVSVGIFGSFARGESTEKSDIDILVKFKVAPSLLTLIKLENELTVLLGIKVDLITTGAIKNKRVQKSIKKDLISIL
jgi:predicted nucleotidyltransferase